MKQRHLVAGGLVLAFACAGALANSSLLFISGQQTSSDSSGGNYLGIQDSLVGMEFSLSQPAAITSVAGVMRTYTANTTVYGAVVPITPGGTVDTSLLNSSNIALIPVQANTVNSIVAQGNVSRIYPAGNYAVIFGTGLPGTSGDAMVLAGTDHINPLVSTLPFVQFNASDQRINQASPVAMGAYGSLLTAPGAGIQLRQPEQVAADNPNLIDFETGTTALPNISGVHFLDIPANPGFGGDATYDHSLFGSQAFGNLVSTTYTNLGMKFDNGISELGFWIDDGYNGAGGTRADLITFRALDAAGNLLYTTDINIPDGISNPAAKLFFGMTSDTPVSRVEWLSNNQGFFTVDNVSYVLAPEPGSLGVIGACMLGFLRRRRRS